MAARLALALMVTFINSIFSSEVSFSHGGYNNLVIGISNQVNQPTNCSEFLNNIETVVQDASQLLHSATEGRAFIRSVSVLLPDNWDLSKCPRTVSKTRVEKYQTTDIRISGSHPLFGDAAWTQQSRGCGQRGDFIYTTAKFFSELNGRQLLREWAKYRYGVFDEIGYFQDSSFPSFYWESLQLKPTGCTDKPINGEKIGCDSASEDCTFLPSGENTHIHSSLMSFPQLPNASEFCDDSNHNSLAPTKHNLICEGRSTKDVIFSNADFSNGNSERANLTKTSFTYQQNAAPRFVLALDRGGAMDERDHWKFARIACRRLILQDFPDQVELGVMTFSDSVNFHTDNLTSLSNAAVREAVASSIPDFLTPTATSSAQESCLACAVKEAIALLERNGGTSAGDVVIIVTSSSISPDQIQTIQQLVKIKKIQLSFVTYAFTGPISSLRALQSFTDANQGYMSNVVSRGVGQMSHISMLIELGDALLSAVHHHFKSYNLPLLIHEQEFGESTHGWVNGTFVIDSNLGRDTILAVYFYSRDNTHVGDMKLISPDGMEYRGKAEDSMASLYFTPLTSIDKPGVWRYSFDRRSQSHQSHFVKVTSKPKLRAPSNQKGTITATLDIVKPTSNDLKTPVTLYAKVQLGELPVLDARVRAIVQYVNSGATAQGAEDNTVIVDLYDNGNADPDITKGDGVYSRYFGNFYKGPGLYSVTLSVDAMDGRAYSVRMFTFPAGDVECCGSAIRVPQDRRELTGAFSRTIPSGLFTVTAGPSSSQSQNASGMITSRNEVDYLPPGRVTDLRVQINTPVQRVTFYWTAVGDDFDIGTAYSYDMRISSNPADLKMDRFDTAESLPVLAMSQSAGTPLQFITEFQRYERPYYVAVRAVDRQGNKGRISNTVEIYMPAPPTTTTTPWPSTVAVIGDPNYNATTFTSQWFTGGLSTVHLAAIVASICVAVLILILIVYFIVHAKRRKEKEAKTPPKFAYVPPVNSTLYKTEKEAANESIDKSVLTDNPYKNLETVYEGKEGSVPVHWSASQLLQEHERRQSPYDQDPNLSYAYEYNISPDNQGMQRNSALYSGSYHINTGSATYGSSEDSNINMYPVPTSTTPPSDSYPSLQSTDPQSQYRPYSVDYERSSVDGYNTGNGHGYGAAKPRPPTLPKPDPVKARLGHPASVLQGSFTSLASERKKRNVTQV